MLSALSKMLGIWTTSHTRNSTEATLFSGSAYFSSRVPNDVSEKWVAYGGEISSGATLDVRARYFFGMDPTEPWVTKLFAKSVMVIHAGWIMHCIDESFQVPIAEYILDDKFVPEPPYKLTSNIASQIYVPLPEPEGLSDSESGDSRLTPVQTSDAPSTPTNMPRERKREQAYFDSPSGSLVFSGFDKDGMPRRPRKQRKLRFDPSFSPQGGRSGRNTIMGLDLGSLRDNYDAARDGDAFSQGHTEVGAASAPRGCMSAVRSPDTPDKPLIANEEPPGSCRHLFIDEHPTKPTRTPSSAITIHGREKMPFIRAIDFTNLPPSTRQWGSAGTEATKSGDTSATLSIVKSTEHKIKTPKKISFADHARVCVYTLPPHRQDTKDDAGAGPARRSSSEGFEDEPEVQGNLKALVSNNKLRDSGDCAAEATEDFAPRADSDPKKLGDDPTQDPDVDQSENDTLTLTMEQVQTMRHRLLVSVERSGVDSEQLSALFELGKTYRGMMFRHVW